MSAPTLPEGQSRLVRAGLANAVAAGVAGVAGMAIVVLAGRTMTPGDYAAFAALWGVVFGCASIVSGVEPEMSREHAESAGPIDRPQAQMLGIVMAAAGLAVGALLVVAHDSLRVQGVEIAVLVVATSAMFPTMFGARGFVSGQFRWIPLAWLTVAEALIRLAVVLVGLVFLDALTAFALAALASAVVGLPILIRNVRWVPGAVPLGAALSRAGTLMLANGLAAVLLTGAPVLVGLAMAGMADRDVGIMQAAIVISRVPLLALILVQGLLVPVFTRRQSLRRSGDFRLISVAVLLSVPVFAIGAWLVGPWVLRTVYSAEYAISAEAAALLTFGAACLASIQILVAVGVAADHHRLALLAFVPAVVVTVGLCAVPATSLLRVPFAFAVGPAVGLAVGWLWALHLHRTPART